MKTRISLRAGLFRFLTLAALAVGGAVVVSQYASFQGYTVSAGCTRAGTATYVNGQPVCDCSAELNGGTCSCIIKCPTGADSSDEAMLMY
ncbi:MAG: hypothetical protein LC802_10965 [Acidobacteria bacterium]|nr:hypothetical protein [Acidobacteriota bacterium]